MTAVDTKPSSATLSSPACVIEHEPREGLSIKACARSSTPVVGHGRRRLETVLFDTPIPGGLLSYSALAGEHPSCNFIGLEVKVKPIRHLCGANNAYHAIRLTDSSTMITKIGKLNSRAAVLAVTAQSAPVAILGEKWKAAIDFVTEAQWCPTPGRPRSRRNVHSLSFQPRL